MGTRRSGWMLVYAVGCYLVGVAGLAYCALFLAGVVVPTEVSADPQMPWALALSIDLLLIVAWGVAAFGNGPALASNNG